MVGKTEYKTVRLSTRQLLERAEGFDVDFKKQANNLNAEEFVAFANSSSGGSLLIGVDEIIDAQGRQRGKVVGCRVDDKAKRQIIDKALSCSPPIDVSVYVENTNDKPFLRVDIASGDKKPYCTISGKYVTREDGRKRSLLPPELLILFLEEQTEQFAARFREATSSLKRDIDGLQKTVQRDIWRITESLQDQFGHIQSVSERIEDVEYEIDRSLDPIVSKLDGIFRSAQNAESLSDDAMDAASEAAWETKGLRDKLQNLHQDVYHVAWKLNALLDNFGVEDPEITRQREYVRDAAEAYFESMAQMGRPNGGKYNMQEVEESYNRLRKSTNNYPGMHKRYEEYVSLDDAKRWFIEGERQQTYYSKDDA